MRQLLTLTATAFVVLIGHSAGLAQGTAALSPEPKPVTMAQLKHIHQLERQLVQINAATVRHADTAQVFTFGDKEGAEIHVVVPRPATDAANIGDTVAITGFVRPFSAGDFERDYSWFRRADYPDLKSGDWVIVATSVRTTEGTELVPPGVMSETLPNGRTP